MSGARALLIGTGLIVVGMVLLVLAALVNEPAFAVAGAACVLGVFVVREAWAWRGQGRQWLAMVGGVAVVVLVAFVITRAA